MKPGNLFEKEVVEYLQKMGFTEARRGGQQGAKDKGDVLGLPLPVTLELKRVRALALGSWWREVQAEMDNNGHAVGAIVHKRHGRGWPGEQWVTMDLLSFTQLLRWASEKA